MNLFHCILILSFAAAFAATGAEGQPPAASAQAGAPPAAATTNAAAAPAELISQKQEKVETVSAPATTNKVASASAAPAAASSAPAPAKTTNSVAPLSLESFQLIADKNIFNQSRVPRVAGRPPPSTNEVKRVPKVDAFALVGTMSYEKGDFAFFDGSNSDYRKTLKAGDKIAGHAIKSIHPSHVTLEWEGNALDVKVGQQLRREDEGAWQVSNRTEAFASSGVGGSGGTSSMSSDSGASSATSSSTSASRSEILKRLLEQRAKQKQ
jgi:hypothetical protein